MKKTISLVLVFAFVFALALQLPVLAEDNNESAPTLLITTSIATTIDETASSSLEKIPSPDKMNLYREIKKIGNDLFGIRKASSTIIKITKNDNKATSSLEKIPSPDKMNLYREIRKIGNDLFGIRKASSTTANIIKNDDKEASSTLSALDKKIQEAKKAGLTKINSLDQVKLFDKITKIGNDLFGMKKKGANILPAMNSDLIACVSTAIDTKDNSVNAAFATANSEMASAISARGTCQKAALALTSEREDAIKACNESFQKTSKTANEKMRKIQQESWNAYKISLKACSANASTTEIVIEDGGEVLQ